MQTSSTNISTISQTPFIHYITEKAKSFWNGIKSCLTAASRLIKPLFGMNQPATTDHLQRVETEHDLPDTIKRRDRIALCTHDAGKSPFFSKSPKNIVNRLKERLAQDYTWVLPIYNRTYTDLEKTIERLLDNICEPWAFDDPMRSWQLHHISPDTLTSDEKCELEEDACSETPRFASAPKAGEGIFTRNEDVYNEIMTELIDKLSELSENREAAEHLKRAVQDPNYWRDLVIEPPKVGHAGGAHQQMIAQFSDTVKCYYSYECIGEGIDDIAQQVLEDKPFLVTAHHSANTLEIASLHHELNKAVSQAQPENSSYPAHAPVRTLVHSTFHEQETLHKVIEGSGCVIATQNVSRTILSNKEAQGIVCATGGTTEAKRSSDDKHTTRWLTVDNQQRNGLAALSIETQTPVSVATCVNADELFTVHENEYTEKEYKETRKSAIDADNPLGGKFYFQLGKPSPLNTMFSAPLPLKHHLSALIKPPVPLEREAFPSQAEFESATKALSTAFSHYLEAHQQEQIFFDLAFTHRNDLVEPRKETYLIYKMMITLIQSESPNDQTGHPIIDHNLGLIKAKFHRFQDEQRQRNLPDNYNQKLNATLMREVYQLASTFNSKYNFFKSPTCQKNYFEERRRVKSFEGKLTEKERDTQQRWLTLYSIRGTYSFIARISQYLFRSTPNAAYLLFWFLIGILKASFENKPINH